MTTITQEPVNIGPAPRCVKVADSGDFWMLAVCCVLGFAMNKAFKWITDEDFSAVNNQPKSKGIE